MATVSQDTKNHLRSKFPPGVSSQLIGYFEAIDVLSGSDGLVSAGSIFGGFYGQQTLSMSGATTLEMAAGGSDTQLTSNWLNIDAGTSSSAGASETLKLPAEADCTSLLLVVKNTGNMDVDITNDADGAVCTVEAGEAALLHCDGTSWTSLVFTAS